jgi:hypothetical protein
LGLSHRGLKKTRALAQGSALNPKQSQLKQAFGHAPWFVVGLSLFGKKTLLLGFYS